MKTNADASRRLSVIGVAAVLALGAGLATAGGFSEIVVRDESPRTFKLVADSQVELYALSRHVSYSDLDLSTPAGAADLQARVIEVAGAVCARLGALYPSVFTSERRCEKDAAIDALAQVHAAIARAGKHK